MQESALDIWNLALSAVHAKGRLTSLTDNKKERYECETWYDITVRTVQEAAFWPSSKRSSVLEDQQEVTDTTETSTHFSYSYRLPYDLIRPRYLVSYLPFELLYDWNTVEVRLHTNDDNARLVYTALQEDVKMWTPGQVMATAYGLAGQIAGPLTGRGELIQKNFRLANGYLMDAQASVLNSEALAMETSTHSVECLE